MAILIIEDEKPAARRLSRMLERHHFSEIILLHSVQSSIEYLLNHPSPDLIFLDIQLSDGLSFEIFEQVEVDSAVIFTTAYDEYALKAFQLNSIDYLLKPIDQEELDLAVAKYQTRISPQKNTMDLQGVNLDQIAQLLGRKEKPVYKKRFTARVGEYLKLLHTRDILLFYSEYKGTYAHLKDGNNYLIEGTLAEVAEALDPSQYYRISRQAILQLGAVKDMVHHTNSRLIVQVPGFTSFDLIVSRERVKDFKNWIEG